MLLLHRISTFRLLLLIGSLTLTAAVVSPARAWIQCGDDPPPCDLREGPQSGPCSPIIVDTDGRGFNLTDAKSGVKFDITGTNHPIQIAWTASGSQNAFLAIDLNHNGKIDSGKELFGNFSPQPMSKEPNGFLALAIYDTPALGGNGDGIIDARDRVFSSLLLWIDKNHDGISQPDELHSLAELGVTSIDLKYRESRRIDEFGNEFRFKGRIDIGAKGSQSAVDHTIYDVFLVSGGGVQ